MKERPISFTAIMGQKVYEGSKTETRRKLALGRNSGNVFEELAVQHAYAIKRYGDIGDVLWVREPYYLQGYWRKVWKDKKQKYAYRFEAVKENPRFIDDAPKSICSTRADVGWFKRHARFMPQRFHRTKLKILSIAVEPIQNITEQAAKREGFIDVAEFKQYFQHLNPGIWERNKFVWVIKFKKIEGEKK
jgi:hypothetical protein